MSTASVIDSLGWTLLHFVWQGALLGCVCALALAALRHARPQHRYNVACAGLLACLLWPAAELLLRLQGGDMVTAQMRFADALVAQSAGTDTAGLTAWLQTRLLWIVGLWAACAALLTLRMGMGLVWIRQTARMHSTHAPLQAYVTRLATGFGVTRKVRLRVVDGLASPITAGWWRPVVLVPAALVTGMPPELLGALLAHEMAHVKRLDYLANLSQNVVEILLFYHPAVWWISGRIRVEREQIADDIAARLTRSPKTLARALSELERMQFSGQHLAMAANGGDLLARVKRLVRPDTQALNWKAAVAVLGLAALCASLVAQASIHQALPLADTTPVADAVPLAATVPVAEVTPVEDTRPMADFRSCPKPKWPAGAIKAGRTGTVTLGFEIASDGQVVDSRIKRSSGHADLDQAARTGIQQCRFAPGTHDGKAARSWMQMQYVWTLK